MNVRIMKRARFTFIVVALTLVALVSPAVLRAQDTGQKAADSGWRSLFNGKDLSGWKQLNGAHLFEVQDGAIVGTTVPEEPNGFLVTEEEFGDFILEFEVRSDVLMNNSGVQFRSLSHEGFNNGRVHGYQAEIDTKPQRWSGSIYDEARRGWLYTTEINPESKSAFKNNEWNSYRIEAIGTTNRIWVNGVPTAVLEDAETLKGFIGLQLHANQPQDPEGSRQIRWRNIRVKTDNLTPSPFDDIFVVNLIPNNISAQEEANGYRLLWDGVSTKGWKAVGGSSFADMGWEIRDGELLVPASGGDRSRAGFGMMTEQQYDAFELQFEFKPAAEGAICGIDYLVSGSIDNRDASTYCQMASKKTRPDRWNRGMIRLFPDDRVEYWLNGNLILEYRRGPGDLAEGHILLGSSQDEMSYRSIKLKELE